jgi:hypothetical protein
MQIDFERSGGFAGMTIQTSVDTDKLPSAESGELVQMITAANFFSLPARTNSGLGADQFNYKITVQSQGMSRTVETTDSTMPPSLKRLVNKLMSLARTAQRS